MRDTQPAGPASIVWGSLDGCLEETNPGSLLEELEKQYLTETLPIHYIQ